VQKRHTVSLQILTLRLDGITADDYLTWCRDPDPPALDFGLRSIPIQADPLGVTITATLDWGQPAPAATAAEPVLCPVLQIAPACTTRRKRWRPTSSPERSGAA